MPLTLIPPGQRIKIRKGKRVANRFILARGRVGGQDIEVSTRTTDPVAAERFAAELVVKLLDSRTAGPGEDVTFSYAATAYTAFRNPGRDDMRRIGRLKRSIGDKRLSELTPHSFIEQANLLYPAAKASSRNRNVITPARFIMHYAAENKWCGYLRIKGFREAKPVTRAVDEATAELLVQNARADLRLLLLVLFQQGFRITDTLRITWKDGIDLTRRVFKLKIGKKDEWREFPIDDEVFLELANVPERLRTGRLFIWRSRWRVYDALEPLCTRLGIKFTPHMARHSLGTWLNEGGEGLRTIMASLGHDDEKSSLRYQSGDIRIVRAAQQRSGKRLGIRKASA